MTRAHELLQPLFPDQRDLRPGSVSDATIALPYDGRLTSLEHMPESERAAVLQALQDKGVYDRLVPEELALALARIVQ